MPRRKSAPTSTSTSTPSTAKKGHKRQLSSAADTPTVTTPGSRASKRLKDSAANTTASLGARRSKYFDGPTDSEDDDVAESTSDEDVGSGYEDEDGDGDVSTGEEDGEASENDEEFDLEEEEDDVKRKRGKKTGFGKMVIGKGKGDERLWREGVKTGLGPGRQVFIAKPKPRGDGGIKYVPEKIHPNTMAFLGDLKKNNDREWFKMHDPDYRESWKDWQSFVDILSEKIAEVDETVPELPAKDLVFRIYRDVRFSKDPTPYKPHFSAAWSRTGRKGPYACYYVQISPNGKSFVGSGLWMPDAQPLRLMRRNFDRRPEKIREILTNPAMRKHILGGISNDEKKAVKAFTGQNQENALKTKPKGYEVDHPNIELLRLRNFTLGRRLSEAEVLGDDVVSTIMDLVGAMVPFVTYLNEVVMPDEDPSSSDQSDEDDPE